MAASGRRSRSRVAVALVAGLGVAALLATGLGLVLIALLVTQLPAGDGGCGTGAGAAGRVAITLGPPGTGQRVGATEYGGPGDPGSGTVGASGANLLAHPDSYAELGGTTFASATAMGGLAYMTPLRITWADRSAIAYKRDFGLGGAPVAGLPRVIDLWWQLAGALGVPYEHGLWSGAVDVERPPATGSAEALAQAVGGPAPVAAAAPVATGACDPDSTGPEPVTSGPRAQLLADGQAAAPAAAPGAVKAIIGAGNQIAGKPYLYGGGHGVPLDEVAPAYDCS